MGFKRFQDNVSSSEAPATTGFFLDASGNPWSSRPDNVIQKYMSQVTLTRDQYWKYKEYIGGRKWFELELFLEHLMKNATNDDIARLAHAKEVTVKLQREVQDGE